MKQLLQEYQRSQSAMRRRAHQLRHCLYSQKLPPQEADRMEERRRLLTEEISEQEQVIHSIQSYLHQKTSTEEIGDASCLR